MVFVQLKEIFTGKVVPKLCAVGKVGSLNVNPFTCALAILHKTIPAIIRKNLEYILSFFIIIFFGIKDYCAFLSKV